MKFYIIIIACLFSSLFTNAQSPKLLEAQGKIPEEFLTSSSEKYKKQLSNLDRKSKSKKREKKSKQQFLLESNFTIDDILQSGLVLFNDPATKYVNEVLKQIPRQNRRGRDRNVKPRAYVLNSPAVNAFATDQGAIFVTLGLLANIENEAQLAFILSHELIHFYHEHSIDKFAHTKEVERIENKNFSFDKNKGNLSVNQQMFKESLYSKKIEQEADEEGFEIFEKTKYDASTIPDVFRILYYSYLPFEDKVFKKSFFEDDTYKLPSSLWLKQVNNIEPMEEKEDKLSSHPASAKRLSHISKKIKSVDNANKQVFIVGEGAFHQIQKRARYQIPFLNLYNKNFPEAIYTAYLLLIEGYEDDVELKKVIGKALHMQAKYVNSGEQNNKSLSNHYEEIADKIQGASQRVYHLLAYMNYEEVLALAMRYNWKLLKENQKDIELQSVVDDLFIEMAIAYENINDFPNTPPAVKAEEPEHLAKSKNEKIKSASSEVKYWKYAFVDFIDDKDFKEGFKEGKKTQKRRDKLAKDYHPYTGKKKLLKEIKKEEKRGKALGLKKVVVINPYYLSVSEDRKYNSDVEYLRTEKKQSNFNKYITDIGKKSKLKVDVLDVESLKTNDVDKFNDIATANRYFSQQMDQYNLSLTPGFEQSEMNKLAKKYNTDYFLWTGVISLQESKKGSWLWVGLSAFYPLVLPFTLYNAITPEYDMFYYAILFDVTTGRRSAIKMDYYDSRDSEAMIKSHIYDTYHQINTRSKK